jgi:hypothetical protein
VILSHGAVDRRALGLLRERTAVLNQRLSDEFQRYQRPRREAMIQIVPYGPVSVSDVPPNDTGTSFWSRALHTYKLWRYTQAVDDAAGVPTHALDSRIYLVAEPPVQGRLNSVAGFGEPHGRVGVARVNLDSEMVDLALFVAAHEFLHTLGATDKYDESGRTSLPFGLPEPNLVPAFPQRYAEVMARNRVLSPTSEIAPETLSELSVGRWTAEEIGWTR